MIRQQLQELLPFSSLELCKKNNEKFKRVLEDLIREWVSDASLPRVLLTTDPTIKIKTKKDESNLLIASKAGGVPHHFIEPKEEFIHVPEISLTTSMDWSIKFSKKGRVDIVERAIRNAVGHIIEQEEDMFFRVIVPAATIGDSFLKKKYEFLSEDLVKDMFLHMKAKGKTLTDLLVSPECSADFREWESIDIDSETRREIFVSGLNSPYIIEHDGEKYEISIHTLNQLGVVGKYNIDQSTSESCIFRANDQNTFNDYELKSGVEKDKEGNLFKSGEEQVYGLDLSDKENVNSVFPVFSDLEVLEDTSKILKGSQSFVIQEDVGMATLNDGEVCMAAVDRSS